MNIYQFAKICSVSSMTVSRAFHNAPDISSATRSRILETARKYHYRPNILARNLATQRSYLIGLVVPNIVQTFFPYIIRTIENLVRKAGYNIILCDSEEDGKLEKEQIRLLIDQHVGGLIIIPAAKRKDLHAFKELEHNGIPFVIVDRKLDGIHSSFIGTNDHRGGFIATQHLIKLGHQKILHLRGPKGVSTARERMLGYRNALAHYAMSFKSNMIIDAGFDEEDGYKTIKSFFKRAKKPTAIFAVNDPVAIGAMKALEELKIKIPDDISIVGFADINYASFLKVPLTTVSQPKQEIGESAAKIILNEIEGINNKEKVKHRNIILEPKLVVRNSTKVI